MEEEGEVELYNFLKEKKDIKLEVFRIEESNFGYPPLASVISSRLVSPVLYFRGCSIPAEWMDGLSEGDMRLEELRMISSLTEENFPPSVVSSENRQD